MSDKQIKDIILIDDEPSVLFALKLLLEAIGYKAKEFSDPELAVNSLKDDLTSQLIICDLRMPKLTGLEVLKLSRTLRPDIPFVLMSAHAGNDEINEAKNLGASGFLAKPFMPDDFTSIVKLIEQA